jgi:hypothetical protein
MQRRGGSPYLIGSTGAVVDNMPEERTGILDDGDNYPRTNTETHSHGWNVRA